MHDLSEMTACVVDHGLFTHIALCLAKKFKKVFYTGPGEEFAPHLSSGLLCDGFDKIVRVKSLWDVKDQVDTFVFPDIGFAGEQRELRRQGLAVWGHHGGDILETSKGVFLETLKDLEMPVPPHQAIRGLEKLRDFLRDREDFWVKLSLYRGDWETFHWRNRVLDETALDCAAYKLGPVKDDILFYVFDKIDTDIEDGIDAWCINGQWPSRVLHAMERKDKSLLGGMQAFDDASDLVRNVNEKFGPILHDFGYRGAFSTEVRIDGDTPYFIDPTCRFGSPPSQLQTELILNLAEVIHYGARGEMIDPETDDELGAQVLITCDRDKDEWLTFQMPDELRPFVKSSFCYQRQGLLQIAPNPLEHWAGWLVATGSTLDEVIDRLKERKDMLPDGFDCDLASLCGLLREMKEAEEHGVEITDQKIPEPATVLEED